MYLFILPEFTSQLIAKYGDFWHDQTVAEGCNPCLA